jgi:hypothetical protein
VKALLACGPIAASLFVFTFLVEGGTRANYNPLRYPISSLSIGDLGWMQICNFLITGFLLVVFSFGLRNAVKLSMGKSKGPLLVGLVGAGFIGAGICSSDPVYGYPEDMPLKLAQYTIHGHLHDLFSMFVFICLPWACFVFRKQFNMKGEKRWARYSAFTGFAVIIAFILAAIGFKQVVGFVNVAGVFQRLTLIIGFAWIAMLPAYFIKTRP